MPRYAVYGLVTGTKFLGEFEAETMEKAIEMAGEDAFVNLCHHCASECDGAEIHEFKAERIDE